jgi:hypothetical protein
MKKHLNKIRTAAFLLTISFVVYVSHKATQANVNQDRSSYGIDDYTPPPKGVYVTEEEYQIMKQALAEKQADYEEALASETHCLAMIAANEVPRYKEPELGVLLIMHTVRNRVNSLEFPNSYCAVMKQKNQFSWYGGGNDYEGANGWFWNGIDYWQLAYSVVSNQDKEDVSLGSLYFRSIDCFKKIKCDTFQDGLTSQGYRQVNYGGGVSHVSYTPKKIDYMVVEAQ